MSDLATLGVIVDATGARREIALTREQLIDLANTGKMTQDVMKQVIPGGGGGPPFVPPNVPGDINKVTEAINRMRQAAAQARADALAGAIKARDPFQGAGFGGPQLGPELPPTLVATSTAAEKARLNVNALRQSMTTLAVTAGAIPGPIGRIASSLGAFTVGSGLIVGVLAGIAAAAFAWNKFTEAGRKAKEMMDAVRTARLSFTGPGGTGSLEGAIDISRGREQRLAKELEDIQGQRGSSFLHQGPIRLALNLMAQERATERLAEERDFLAAATTRAAKAERDLGIEVSRSNQDRVRTGNQRLALAQQQGIATLAGVTAPWNPNADVEAVRAVELLRNKQEAVNASIEARRRLTGENLQNTLAAIEAEKKVNDAIANGNAALAIRLVRARQIADAKMDLAQWGLGKIAGGAGPFGGLVQGVGSNLLAGNPFGAAVAGVTGLIDGLISLGGAAREFTAQLAAMRQSFANFMDSVNVELGRLSPVEAQLHQDAQRFAAERKVWEDRIAAINKLFDSAERSAPGSQIPLLEKQRADALAEAQRNIDSLNDAERALIEQRRKQAEETERLTNAIRNAPSGFFPERFLRDAIGAGSGAPIEGPVDRPRGPGGAGGPRPDRRTLHVQGDLNVQLPAGSSKEQVTAFVRALDEFTASTLGAGGSRAAALELVN